MYIVYWTKKVTIDQWEGIEMFEDKYEILTPKVEVLKLYNELLDKDDVFTVGYGKIMKSSDYQKG